MKWCTQPIFQFFQVFLISHAVFTKYLHELASHTDPDDDDTLLGIPRTTSHRIWRREVMRDWKGDPGFGRNLETSIDFNVFLGSISLISGEQIM